MEEKEVKRGRIYRRERSEKGEDDGEGRGEGKEKAKEE